MSRSPDFVVQGRSGYSPRLPPVPCFVRPSPRFFQSSQSQRYRERFVQYFVPKGTPAELCARYDRLIHASDCDFVLSQNDSVQISQKSDPCSHFTVPFASLKPVTSDDHPNYVLFRLGHCGSTFLRMTVDQWEELCYRHSRQVFSRLQRDPVVCLRRRRLRPASSPIAMPPGRIGSVRSPPSIPSHSRFAHSSLFCVTNDYSSSDPLSLSNQVLAQSRPKRPSTSPPVSFSHRSPRKSISANH